MSSGGNTTDIRARIGLDGAPQFTAQADAAASALGRVSDAAKRVAASSDDIARVSQSTAAAGAGLQNTAAGAQRAGQGLDDITGAANRAGGALGKLGSFTLGVGGLLAFKAVVGDIAGEILQTQIRAETLQNALKFAVGPNTGAELDYLRRVTSELGLEFNSSAKAYAGFAAAARETRLEGAGTRQVFEAVAKASAVMGLSAADSQGVLLALQQMMSKGVVQAEELRGQLGERLPGAFQIAARSMGVTTAELGKMLETGQVLADDFLPKFANQLNKELGDGATNAANRTEAAINRLSNSWERFKQVAGEGVSAELTATASATSKELDYISAAIDRAKAKGSGFFGQFFAGAGAVAALALPIDAVGRSLQTASDKLKEAEADLARLRAGLESNPGNILLGGAIRDTEKLIAQLKLAQQETAKLALPNLRAFDNATVSAYERQVAQERAESEGKVLELRNKALGVNKEYVASVTALDVAQRRGIITDKERIELVGKLTAATYKATGANSNAYASLVGDINKLIELNDSRAASSGLLSKAEETELSLNARLAGSIKSLTAAQAEAVRQLIAKAKASVAAAEAAERERKAAEQIARARSDARAAEEKAIESAIDGWQRERDAAIKSVQDRVSALQDEAEAAQLSARQNVTLAEAVEMVAIARAQERQERYTPDSAAYQDIEREIQARQRLLELIKDKATRESAADAAKDAAKAWEGTVNDIRQGLTDAIRRGLEDHDDPIKAFGDALGNEVKTRVMVAVAEALTSQLLSSIGVQLVAGSAGSVGGNAQGYAQMLQSAQSLYGYGTKAYNWATGLWGSGGTTAGAVNLGTATGADLAMFYSGDAAAGAGATAGTAGSSSAMGSLGTYAGYAALIYAAAQYGSKLYDQGFTGSAQLQDKWWYRGSDKDLQTRGLKALGLSDKWAEILGGSVRWNHMFGRSAYKLDETGITGTLGQGGFAGEQYSLYKAKGGLFRSDDLQGMYGAVDDTLNRFLNDSARAVLTSAEDYGKALGLPVEQLAKINADLKVVFTEDEAKNRAEIEAALGGYRDALVAGFADAVAPLSVLGETTSQTLARVSGAIVGVNQVLEALGATALKAGVDGGAAAVKLQDLFGGIGGLQQSATSYLQNYYTEAERNSLVTAQITKTLAAVGLQLPATTADFRGMVQQVVDGGGLLTDAGRAQYAALMSVQDAFKQVTETVSQSAAQISAERGRLQDELDQMLGNTAAIEARARAQVAPENLDLYDQIQAAKAQQAAAEAAARAQEEAAAAEAERISQANAQGAAYYQRMYDAASAAQQAWQPVWDGIRDAANNLRDRGAFKTAADVQAQFTVSTAQARAGSLQAAQALPGLAQSLAELLAQSATSAADLVIRRASIANSLDETLRIARGVPHFAGGGSHYGGLRVVGENGPELEMTGPSRILSHDELRALVSPDGASAELRAELLALRQELAALRAESAIRADRSFRLIDNLTEGGTQMPVKVLP